MSRLLQKLNPEVSVYKDRRFDGDEEDWQRALRTSTTVYIGNLAFRSSEDQIYEIFSQVGCVDRVVMGLDKVRKTACGFAFVIYYMRKEAEAAVRYLNGTLLDDRIIRVDHDWGFVEGRQWGRGNSGGQVRDEFRTNFDADRGGFGKVVYREMASLQQQLPQALAGAIGSPGYGGGGGRMGMSPLPTGPANKRQRTDPHASTNPRDGDGAHKVARAAVEDNPRFRERRRQAGSDEEDDR